MLLVCIVFYLKSVLRHAYLSLGTYHPDTLNLNDHYCDYSWLLLETTGGVRSNEFWAALSEVSSEYEKLVGSVGQEISLGKSGKQIIIKYRLSL